MTSAVDTLRRNMVKYGSQLLTNRIQLVSRVESTQLVNGTPTRSTTDAVHWEGNASLQFVRPTGNNFVIREDTGTIEDNVSFIAYVPFESNPDEGLMLVDLDGILGREGAYYRQMRRPANVGGVSAYFELYLGFGPND